MNDRKKRLYAILIGGALTALATDKLMLGNASSPAAAAASDLPGRASVLSGVGGSATFAATGGTMAIPELPFPRSLPPYDPQMDRRDLFSIPDAVRDRIWGEDGDPRRRPETPVVKGAGQFRAANHRLMAVLVFQGRTAAIVDDLRLGVGDVVDDCQVVDIDIAAGTVRFSCTDGEATLLVHPINADSGS